MTTLIEFLLARLEADELTAQAAIADNDRWKPHWSDGAYQAVVDESGRRIAETDNQPAAEHIARHGPSRVLAECEAKRRIVELHRLMDYDQPYRGTPCCERCTAGGEYPADDGETDEQNWPCPTLRALALPYADHLDYREAWKP